VEEEEEKAEDVKTKSQLAKRHNASVSRSYIMSSTVIII